MENRVASRMSKRRIPFQRGYPILRLRANIPIVNRGMRFICSSTQEVFGREIDVTLVGLFEYFLTRRVLAYAAS